MIVCEKCKEDKELYGKKPICKKCYMDDYNKKYYEQNNEKIKKQNIDYYFKFHDKNKKTRRDYSEKNRDKILLDKKEYYKENKERMNANMKINYEKNKIRYNKVAYQNKKIRLENDVNFYIKDRLSTRIRMAIMNHSGQKQTSSIELLGADIETVRKHIESQFTEGMHWGNHGDWEFDHIIPCDSFDLTKEEEQKKCFYYKNLQPLWYPDNNRKGNKILTEEELRLLRTNIYIKG